MEKCQGEIPVRCLGYNDKYDIIIFTFSLNKLRTLDEVFIEHDELLGKPRILVKME